MSSCPTPIHVHVEAEIHLAEAGLQRAAHRAGLRVVAAEEPASFTLRSVNLPTSEPGIDVLVGGDGIELIVRNVPNTTAWTAIRRLLQQLVAEPPNPARNESDRSHEPNPSTLINNDTTHHRP